MDHEYSDLMRYTFIVHIPIGVLFGLAFLLIPDIYGDFIDWEMEDPAFRLLGAALLGLTAGSVLALRDRSWEKVRILVEIEVIWLFLGALATVYGMLTTEDYPAIGWLNVIILLGLLAAFSWNYYTEMKTGQ
jgi:hypothetical protein